MDRGWYVVHTQSGWEDRVRSHLEQKVATENLKGKVFQVLIPTERVVEVKKNKKSEKKRKFFPGYILLDMVVDNETYWVVKNINGVKVGIVSFGGLGEHTSGCLKTHG